MAVGTAGVEVLIEPETYTALQHPPRVDRQSSTLSFASPCSLSAPQGSDLASQKASHTTSVAVGALLCRLFTEESHMATNLALDQELLDRAFRVSGEPTKKAAVTRALQEFIARREQRRVAELFGQLEWDTSFDYKAERARKQ